ncbi:DUF1764-domain-containing protein [Hygrophoropsis aurantiaca]|uniref:DUF1764-domain-containing protein n=1 Tax=Hygrophoropsis aurantiaca TaxID=72124 RepID=A0ACB8AQ29_9AGAM|nr:DUF1764-domain-containing protein [Hygrophoropsis aurantiaca]
MYTMSASEIDAIFASKGKTRGTESTAPSSLPKQTVKKKKKKDKNTKLSADVEITAPETTTAGKKRPIAQTVVDPSAAITAKRARVESSTVVRSEGKVKAKDDDARFKDSRGNGPRRKTEDGFSIYKEDELGISKDGGDTPLCPFDCDCCF